MALWLLEARDDLEKGNDPWEPWYDKTFGMVIRGDSEKEIREIAQDKCQHGDESHEGVDNPWLKKEYSECTKILSQGIKEIILVDFRSA